MLIDSPEEFSFMGLMKNLVESCDSPPDFREFYKAPENEALVNQQVLYLIVGKYN